VTASSLIALSIPRGLTIKQFDIEEPSWDSLLFDCNLVHMRLLFGSIETDLWPEIYRKIFNHLAPGKGYVEHEVDWTSHWKGDDIPIQSAFMEWAELFLKGMDHCNRSARVTTIWFEDRWCKKAHVNDSYGSASYAVI
jgi:hypothetical protein